MLVARLKLRVYILDSSRSMVLIDTLSVSIDKAEPAPDVTCVCPHPAACAVSGVLTQRSWHGSCSAAPARSSSCTGPACLCVSSLPWDAVYKNH